MSPATKRAKKLLDQQLVTEFAEYRSLKTKIEKWLKACGEDFVAKFKDGVVCPSDGPYLIVLGGQDRKNIDWKQEFFQRLKGDFESGGSAPDVAEQLAIVKMVEMERLAGTHRIDQLDVKVNPSYAGKVMRAIVRKLDARNARGF
jgi:hypothetical protein